MAYVVAVQLQATVPPETSALDAADVLAGAAKQTLLDLKIPFVSLQVTPTNGARRAVLQATQEFTLTVSVSTQNAASSLQAAANTPILSSSMETKLPETYAVTQTAASSITPAWALLPPTSVSAAGTVAVAERNGTLTFNGQAVPAGSLLQITTNQSTLTFIGNVTIVLGNQTLRAGSDGTLTLAVLLLVGQDFTVQLGAASVTVTVLATPAPTNAALALDAVIVAAAAFGTGALLAYVAYGGSRRLAKKRRRSAVKL